LNVLRDLQILGWLLVVISAAQLIPAAGSLIWGEPALPFFASAIAAAVPGLLIAVASQPPDNRLRIRDGFVLAFGAWLLAAFFGALPYVMTGILHPLDAFFESVSGFTTTASSVLRSVESLPYSLLLWRSMTQWLGGMGVLLIAVALLPFLGIGGMQLFASDETRSTADSGRPRFAAVASRLFGVYLGLTALAFALLSIAGLGSFDALCHALTGVSTGGFSTRDGSVGSFGSPAVEWAVIFVIFLGATNFVIHYRIISRRGAKLWYDGEVRYYVGAIVVASALLAWSLASRADASADLARPAIFQTVSMLSGAGYYSADYTQWSGFAQLILLGLMVLGGMAGSTTGGIKSLRLLIGIRALRHSFTMLLHPHAVHRVKYAGRAVPDEIVAAIWAFLTAYFAIVGVAAVIVASAGYDLVTAISVAFSMTSNVGPALGAAGPGTNFADFPDYAKYGLCFCMLAGRLDVFTILILLLPRFWRT
jgi:trk system potassium uptake protein TrkH